MFHAFVKKLKFCSWSFNFFNNVCGGKVSRSVEHSMLLKKLKNSLFFYIVNANLSNKLLTFAEAAPVFSYFLTRPNLMWNSYNPLFYFFNENILNDKSLNSHFFIFESLSYAFGFWIWFPECISELKKYYPVLNLIFDDCEFSYIDSWIEVLPVFEDCLGHLLTEDSPLLTVSSTAQILYVSADALKIFPPLKENINFSKHLEDYYFGQNSHPYFLEVITLYLNKRPSLKEDCEIAWNKDKAENKDVSNNLTVYFVCNFLIKNISQYTLRFVVANTPVAEIKPIKNFQLKENELWKNMSLKDQNSLLLHNRNILLEQISLKNKLIK